MCDRTWARPEVGALLDAAKEAPEDDGPRLVLADWLDDHGEHDRAEFVRTQLRLAPGSTPPDAAQIAALRRRSAEVLGEHGGCWLGPLWRFWLSPVAWHRGLLTVGLPRGIDPEPVACALRWADGLAWQAGPRGFARLGRLLQAASPNHLLIDLRRPMSEGSLLARLREMPAPPWLRTLGITWPLGMLRRGGTERCPAVSGDFIASLMSSPLGRALTHLASSPAWSPRQQVLIRSLGAEPACSERRPWMHALPAASFARRPEPRREEEP
jgi:uncharacterized protein (TIGR02996 family)